MRKHRRRNPQAIIESDPEDGNESDTSSGDDPLFHDVSQSSLATTPAKKVSPASQNEDTAPKVSLHPPLSAGTAANPKPAEPHSRSASPDEPLAAVVAASQKVGDGAVGPAPPADVAVPNRTAVKAYRRPLQHVEDKHRQKRIQFIGNLTVKHGPTQKPTMQSSSSKDIASPISPVTALVSRGITPSSIAPAVSSPIQRDQPVLPADTMSPTLDLGPSSPTTLSPPATNSQASATTVTNTDTKFVPCLVNL